MSHHLLGAAAILLAGLFGWFCVRDADQGMAELPRTMWRVERRYDAVLFWLFTGLDCVLIAMAILAGVELLSERS